MTPPATATETDADQAIPDAPRRRGPGVRERVVAHALAADVARLHGEALLRTARRYSGCAEDAHDAYQRALELLLEHAGTIDRAKAVSWMQVVIRRECSAMRRQRDRVVAIEAEDFDDVLGRTAPAVDEQLHAIDLARSAGEALATLTESEAQALCLRAQGMSYDEIADLNGWSYTKVNRAVTEGRRAFVQHYRAVESGVVCESTAELLPRFLADELSARSVLKVRAHLVRCAGCRSLLHAERSAEAALRALLPPVFVVAASGRLPGGGWLHDHLLGPLAHAAGRLQPMADHLVGSKLGLVAASSLALAGSGLAVEQQLVRDPGPPRALQAGLTAPATPRRAPATAVTAPSAKSPIVRVVDRAIDENESARARVRQRAAAAAERRRATAARKRAAAVKRRRIANEREFATGASEFDSTTRASARRSAQRTQATTTASGASVGGSSGAGQQAAASAPAPEIEVPVGGGGSESTVDVVTESAPPQGGSSGGVAGEFGD